MEEQKARGLGSEAPRDPTLERLIAFSGLASLGHSTERLKQLAPKVTELYAMIDKIRAADVAGHEMTVNYWTGPYADPDPLTPRDSAAPQPAQQV